jgi:hypothetical protein
MVEMFRRKHGRYPETLEALVPEFISEVPRDWMGASPAEKMLLVRSQPEPIEPLEGGSVETALDEQPSAGGLIIYSRGRTPGDGGGTVDDSSDVGIRIPIPPAQIPKAEAKPE